jgi:hypothetical protein
MAELVAVDYQADLSLVRIDVGPLPYVCPPASPGTRPGRALSAGYDEMQWPATVRPATITRTDGQITFTRERPWHGRSGGSLIDADLGRLIGVVSGYDGPRASDARGNSNGTKRNFAEVARGGNGIYVSHAAIVAFLQKSGCRFGDAPQAEGPAADPFRQPFPVPRAAPQPTPQACPT